MKESTILISGYWIDNGEKFEDKKISPTLLPSDLETGDYFYWGLDLEDIKHEISIGTETQLDFVITSYKVQ